MLDQLSTSKKVVGLKQSRKAVQARQAIIAFVADDADDKLKIGFIDMCKQNGVPVFHARTMAELGRACGIEVGSGFAALIK